MVQEFVKTYVEAVVKVLPDGQKRPLTIVFESRKKYAIDRVRRVTRACATKVGGTGIRYRNCGIASIRQKKRLPYFTHKVSFGTLVRRIGEHSSRIAILHQFAQVHKHRFR